jgi:hypothetical protein
MMREWEVIHQSLGFFFEVTFHVCILPSSVLIRASGRTFYTSAAYFGAKVRIKSTATAGSADTRENSPGLEDACRRVAVEANEDVDHAGVGEGHFVPDRVELTVESHRLLAVAAGRDF